MHGCEVSTTEIENPPVYMAVWANEAEESDCQEKQMALRRTHWHHVDQKKVNIQWDKACRIFWEGILYAGLFVYLVLSFIITSPAIDKIWES